MSLLTVSQAAALCSALPIPAPLVLLTARFINPVPKIARVERNRRAYSALVLSNHRACSFGSLSFHGTPTYASGRRRDKAMRLCDVQGCCDYDPYDSWVVSTHDDPFEREFIVCGNCAPSLWDIAIEEDSVALGRTVGPKYDGILGPGLTDVNLNCIPKDLRGREIHEFCEFQPHEMMMIDSRDRFYEHGEHPLRPYGRGRWR